MSDPDPEITIDAYLNDRLPPGSIVNGYVVVVSYLDPEAQGDPAHYSVFCAAELPLSSTLGLLELAKMDLYERSQVNGD